MTVVLEDPETSGLRPCSIRALTSTSPIRVSMSPNVDSDSLPKTTDTSGSDDETCWSSLWKSSLAFTSSNEII
ncbi:hypothetical protein OGAPHI_004474 [Ogataea philodendri]|uniref:Uncharacterized protein n=1 Tax=Ogataea philodendri TaxID=1378263 RepID=A0A9P8P6S3_9ASCO|nr:uncharacterized protein OGAPHI_004474 [Ogataea philodendri]KAH3666285.1 hypothetical protein OGAPHI_004474 [Ogataea philodendri]